MSTTTPDPTNATPATCPCGHDRAHPTLLPVKRRSLVGAMALLMGFTARPARIDWVCPTCGAVLDAVTDSATLERFRYDEPRRTGRRTARGGPTRHPLARGKP